MSETPTERPQRTLEKAVSFEGTGLHTGVTVKVECKPAPADSGIVFRRSDLPESGAIPAHMMFRCDYPRRTALREPDGEAEVHTVEHMLSAAYALGIDNMVITLDAHEPPGLDGSAQDFLKHFQEAGIVDQEIPVTTLRVREAVGVGGRNSSVVALPNPGGGLRLSYTLDYPVPTLGSQYFEVRALTPELYAKDIAPARTFVMEAEAEMLKKAGMGLGANFQNTCVYGEKGVIETELRFPDEAVRHKMLDLIGDLSLLGQPIEAHIIGVKSGHELNAQLVKELLEAHGDHDDDDEDALSAIQDVMALCYPMLLVDRLIDVEGVESADDDASADAEEGSELGSEPGDLVGHAVGYKNVSLSDPALEGGSPSHSSFPNVLVVEALTQITGAMLIVSELFEGHFASLTGLDRLKFHKTVVPGDQVLLEADLESLDLDEGKGVARVRASVEGESACDGLLEFMIVTLDSDD